MINRNSLQNNFTTLKHQQSKKASEYSLISYQDPVTEQIPMLPVNQTTPTKQKELVASDKKYLIAISEEYYNQKIALQAATFFNKLRHILTIQEEILIKKRKIAVDNYKSCIKRDLSKIKQQLTQEISTWCKTIEQQEIAFYLQTGQKIANESLIYLSSKIIAKRQDIQSQIAKIHQCLDHQQPISKEELVRRSLEIKTVLKSTWQNEYELEVAALQRLALNVISDEAFCSGHGEMYLEQFRRKTESVLYRHHLFSLETGKEQQAQKYQSELLHSLLQEKTTEIQRLRRQREAEIYNLSQSYLQER